MLPSVTTTIFQTFRCTNVDPDSEDDDASDRFLSADMSVSCGSAYYDRWVAYASAMIVSRVRLSESEYSVFFWYAVTCVLFAAFCNADHAV